MAVGARWGKALYAAAFTLAVPALLVFWSWGVESHVPLPLPGSRPFGVFLIVLATALWASSVFALSRWGAGLPMNAYPPERFVRRGIYRLLDHPIYFAFCAAVAGAAIAFRSSAGFWIVLPAVCLGCTALVWGFENADIDRLFGPTRPPALLRLPPETDDRPGGWDVAAVVLKALLPWLVVYETLAFLGPARDAAATYLPSELGWPVWAWTEPIYASTYVVVLAAPFLARTRRDLRAFAVSALFAMALIFPLFLVLPLQAPPRGLPGSGVFGALLALERRIDTAAEAFPSFHVVWAWIACRLLEKRSRWARVAWRSWAVAVTASCVTTGMHSLADVGAGLVVFAIVDRRTAVWEFVRGASERIANSWTEWRIGRLRVINHGMYPAVGTLIGLLIVSSLVGPGNSAAVWVTATAGLVGAGVWAQVIEGSPQLMRPYGFYGGLFGVMLATLAAPLFGTGTWLVLAAFAVAAPWIQSFGRLRCLIQGCCHGREAPEGIGIRYRHPRSRVLRLAGLGEVPLHPTPVYSILWNALVAAVTIRLWLVHAPLHGIVSAYLILTGLGRFVEEAYRGEPQTPVIGRLRLYQWVAASTVFLGILLAIAGASDPAPPLHSPGTGLATAFAFAAIVGIALGVDFPESNRPLSRLA